MNQREFEILIQSVIEGDATRDEAGLLEAELLASRERRTQFRRAVLLDRCLSIELGAGQLAGGPAVNVIPVREILRRERRRGMVATLLISAAIFAALVVALRLILAPEPSPVLTVEFAPNTDFTVTHAHPHGREGEKALRLEPGSRVKIRQGSMRLDFAAGVEGVVLGPADLTLHGPLAIAMPYGTARFRVEPQGRGFKVATPLVEVVDLGTEFGILADGQHPPQIHVFEGKVTASAQKGLQENEVIGTGEAVEVSGIGKFSGVKLDAGKFLTELPVDLPYLHIPFETDAVGNLMVRGTHPAVVTTRARLDPRGGALAEGRVGQAVSLPGLATPVRTTWMGVRGEAPRTIAMWVKPGPGTSSRELRSLAIWGTRNTARPAMCELMLFSAAEGRPTTLRLAFNHVFYTGRTNLADGKWHHVAAVFRGSQVRPGEKIVTLYVDGEPEEIDLMASREAEEGWMPDTLTDSPAARPLLIGSADHPGVDGGYVGLMDEFYVFEAALDEERIRELARTGAGGAEN